MGLIGRFIGIDSYQDKGIYNLGGAAKRDAQALYGIFMDSFSDIDAELIIDEKATCKLVHQSIIDVLKQATEKDDLVISFSGHGHHDHRLIATDSSNSDFENTTISMEAIADAFRDSSAKSILLILDCCFSGGTTAKVFSHGPKSRDFKYSTGSFVGKGRVLITASGFDEPAYENSNTGHGLLTHAILKVFTRGEEQIKLATAMDEVISIIKAESCSIGRKQTPVAFNLVEGSFSIKRLVKGNVFYTFFPDTSKIQIGNQILELVKFGLPGTITHLWTRYIDTELLPLQVAAINDFRILDGESVFVSAPTSTGKTFIGELAAIKNILNSRKVIFLLPYRALVNEKFEKFTELYQDKFNVKIIRCSGDYLDQTTEFIRNKYDIAFLTYEMFLALVLNNSSILLKIGLIVIDEVQFIGNDNRGIVVELILTRLKIANQDGIKPQIILLSATVGDINRFNDWLNVKYLFSKKRPVPLEFGVIDRTGSFRFKDKDGNLQEESLLSPYSIQQRRKNSSSQDLIVPLCRKLLKDNKDAKILIFRNTRGAAEGCSAYLSRELGLESAAEVTEQLPALDLSNTALKLKESLKGGTAFHNSNLTREQRSAVEKAFRDPKGKVKVLVSTSTLAAGVNTPASHVIIVENSYPWDSKEYTIGEVHNMAGRAGRLGFREIGTAILYADNFYQKENLYNKYIQAVPGPISSSFKEDDIGTWIIKLLSQVEQVDISELPLLLSNTFGGYLKNLHDPNWLKNISKKVSTIVEILLKNQLVEQSEENLRLSLLGIACGQSSFSLPSCLNLLGFFRKLSDGKKLTPLDLAALVQNILELDSQYVPLNKRGNSEAKWPQKANSFIDSSIIRILQFNTNDLYDFYARCKKICILREWIKGTPVESIETGFTTNPFHSVGFGDVRSIADSTRFHLRSAFNILNLYKPVNCPEPDSMENFLKQLEIGIPEQALDLLKLPVQLERGEYLGLISKGITNKQEFSSPERFKDLKKIIRPDLLSKILDESRLK